MAKRIGRAALASLVAVIAAALGAQSLVAANPAPEQAATTAQTRTIECDGATAEALPVDQEDVVDDTEKIEAVKAMIESDVLVLAKIEADDLAWAEAVVEAGADGEAAVIVPAAKFEDDPSVLVVTVDAELNLEATVEVYVSEVSADLYLVDVYRDGSSVTASLSTEIGSDVQIAGFSWDKFKECVTDYGASAFLVAMVGTACGIGGAISGGTVWALCAAGVLGFEVGVVIDCVIVATSSATAEGTGRPNAAGLLE
ncbi:hypothetical protein [Salininema proteolyticum]|uniref:TPM domain-containing protein n=1 Tax=Salininema proteolyticum TaxID=1607685 RepID=A0ABV8TVX1_9ACTN